MDILLDYQPRPCITLTMTLTLLPPTQYMVIFAPPTPMLQYLPQTCLHLWYLFQNHRCSRRHDSCTIHDRDLIPIESRPHLKNESGSSEYGVTYALDLLVNIYIAIDGLQLCTWTSHLLEEHLLLMELVPVWGPTEDLYLSLSFSMLTPSNKNLITKTKISTHASLLFKIKYHGIHCSKMRK